MTPTVMLVLVYLTNGIPLPNFFVVPEGVECNGALAIDYSRRFIQPSLGEGFQIQDPSVHGNYICLPVPAPIAPGPADPGARPVPVEPEPEPEPLSKRQRDA